MDNRSLDSSGQLTLSTVPPVDVPPNVWHHHPVLRDAQVNVNHGGLEWPKATFEQLPFLRNIALVDEDGILCARLPAQFNFDRFVDAHTDENAPAQPPGHTDDCQRFYTRVTESGFHFVGVFCALTISGRRRYFQWLTSSWVEVGLRGFLLARDARETQFAEVSADQLDASQRGASSTPVVTEEKPSKESVMESSQSYFIDEPATRRTAAHRLPALGSDDTETGGLDVSTSSLPAGTMPMGFATQEGIAIAIATIVHRGDVDFGGASSIDHVARVAESFDRENESTSYCVAWLHDVLEVGALLAKDLLDAGVSPEIVNAVSLLTRTDNLDEGSWLKAIADHPVARAVKVQSVADNSAAWRLRRLDPATRAEVEDSCARARVYLSEMAM